MAARCGGRAVLGARFRPSCACRRCGFCCCPSPRYGAVPVAVRVACACMRGMCVHPACPPSSACLCLHTATGRSRWGTHHRSPICALARALSVRARTVSRLASLSAVPRHVPVLLSPGSGLSQKSKIAAEMLWGQNRRSHIQLYSRGQAGWSVPP